MLPVPLDFDWGWVLSFLRPRAIPALERVDAEAWTRAVRLAGRPVVVRITRRAGGLALHAAPATEPRTLRALFRSVLDTRADPASFRARAASDALLGPLVATQPGVRLVCFPDPFEGLIRGILGQQVSLAAAATTAGRIVGLFGEPVRQDAGALHAFPLPTVLAEVGERRLRGVGLTGAKARAVLSAAAAAAHGSLDLAALARAPAAEADAALRALPGVGPWTAAYVRMRGLGDPDAYPASDLGVLKALARRLGRAAVSVAESEALAAPWRPWRAYATLHLWQSLSAPA
jgi:3-methyladenine DNA glycosylase/8-oxoguanine DNA glycosylase